MIQLITDHIQQAQDKLREQYKNKPNFLAFLDTFVKQVQDLEEVFYNLSVSRSILEAIGIQLDLLGELLNRPRQGKSDEAYRISLLAKIAKNISRGTPEDVLGVFKILTSSNFVEIMDGNIGEIILLADHTLTQADVNTVLREMQSVPCAGVRISAVGSFNPIGPFAFFGPRFAKGFGSNLSSAPGGKLSTIKKGTEHKFSFAGVNQSNDGFGTLLDPYSGGVLATI